MEFSLFCLISNGNKRLENSIIWSRFELLEQPSGQGWFIKQDTSTFVSPYHYN
jgi:hypothetical protein